MSDLPDTPPGRGGSSGSRGSSSERSGLRRRTSFAFGIVLGFVLGIAAAVLVPDLFPEGELACERPASVLWEQTTGGAVSLEVEYAGDGTDGCDANVVFSEPPNQ